MMSFHRFFPILFFFGALSLPAATCVTSGSGAMNWSDATRWSCGKAPEAGDTVTLGHAVTVDQDAVAGTSGPTGTVAILINSAGGSLRIASGKKLTIRGDVTQNGPIYLECGSTWEWDGSGANVKYKAAPSAHNLTAARVYTTLPGEGPTGNCTTDPVSVRSVLVGAGTGTANGYWETASFLESGQWDVQGINFLRIGDSSTYALRHYISSAAAVFRMRNFTFTDSGGIKRGGNSPGNGAATFVVSDGVWSNTQTAYSLDFNASAGRTTGTWQIQRNYFDKRFGDPAVPALMAGMTITHNVMAQTLSSSGGVWDQFEWNVVVDPRNQNGNDTNFYGDVVNSYFVETGDYNPHFIILANTTRNQLVDGVLLQYTGPGSDGDGVLVSSTAASLTHTVKRCIVVPKSGGSGVSSSTLVTYLASQTPPKTIVEHNTYPGSLGGEHGFQYSEGVAGGTPAGSVLSFRSNLFWAPSVIAGENHFNPFGTVNDNMTAPENITNNAAWNAGVTSRPGKSSDGGYYDIATTGAVPGANDVNVDPKFVDSARNFEKAAQALYGADGTVAGTISALKVDPANRIPALIQWVRDGFAPTNRALKMAAHDGGDIGAVAVQAQTANFVGAHGNYSFMY